jgi:hypothetical protein
MPRKYSFDATGATVLAAALQGAGRLIPQPRARRLPGHHPGPAAGNPTAPSRPHSTIKCGGSPDRAHLARPVLVHFEYPCAAR